MAVRTSPARPWRQRTGRTPEEQRRADARENARMTEIIAVQSRTVRIPLAKPGFFSIRTVAVRHYTLLRVRCSDGVTGYGLRSEEHTSELQSLMRRSYADICVKKKPKK